MKLTFGKPLIEQFVVYFGLNEEQNATVWSVYNETVSYRQKESTVPYRISSGISTEIGDRLLEVYV